VISGCFDKIVRVWNVKSRKVIDWQQTSHYITALNMTSNGDRLCVGLINGDIVVYDSNNGPAEAQG
jgi:WD40 repeat protein